MNKEQKSLWLGIGVVIAVVAVVAIIGIFALQPEPEMITGEVCADEYRVANKVPGRLSTLFVEEGQQVRAGDTLAYISSPELYQKAKAGEEIYRKSYSRVQRLYDKGVVSAQKRDEVEAQYKAAVATSNAAKLQYEMAREGAQNEDKEAANALVQQAQGAVSEVEAYVQDRYLLAPCDGEVAEIYAKRSDLIGTGSPVMSILDMSNVWISVSVREDMLGDLRVGSLAEIKIPALGDQTYTARVTYLRAMATYAVWRATKINGQYDVKSFDVKLVPQEPIDGLRPGMTAIVVNE